MSTASVTAQATCSTWSSTFAQVIPGGPQSYTQEAAAVCSVATSTVKRPHKFITAICNVAVTVIALVNNTHDQIVMAVCSVGASTKKQAGRSLALTALATAGVAKQVGHAISSVCKGSASRAITAGKQPFSTCTTATNKIVRVGKTLLATVIDFCRTITEENNVYIHNSFAVCNAAVSKAISIGKVIGLVAGSSASIVKRAGKKIAAPATTVASTITGHNRLYAILTGCIATPRKTIAVSKSAAQAIAISAVSITKQWPRFIATTCMAAARKAVQVGKVPQSICGTSLRKGVAVSKSVLGRVIAAVTSSQVINGNAASYRGGYGGGTYAGRTYAGYTEQQPYVYNLSFATVCSTALRKTVSVGKSLRALVKTLTRNNTLVPSGGVGYRGGYGGGTYAGRTYAGYGTSSITLSITIKAACSTTVRRAIAIGKSVFAILSNVRIIPASGPVSNFVGGYSGAAYSELEYAGYDFTQANAASSVSTVSAVKQVSRGLGTGCAAMAGYVAQAGKAVAAVCVTISSKTVQASKYLATTCVTIASIVGPNIRAVFAYAVSTTVVRKTVQVGKVPLAIASTSISYVRAITKSVFVAVIDAVTTSTLPSTAFRLFAKAGHIFVSWFARTATGTSTVSLASGWSGRLAITEISSQSLIWVQSAITAEANPTTDVVEMAFLGPYADASTANEAVVTAETVWYGAVWGIPTSYPTTYPCQCLVGPGGTVTLSPGTYCVWVKIYNEPEVPVIFAGPLAVS